VADVILHRADTRRTLSSSSATGTRAPREIGTSPPELEEASRVQGSHRAIPRGHASLIPLQSRR